MKKDQLHGCKYIRDGKTPAGYLLAYYSKQIVQMKGRFAFTIAKLEKWSEYREKLNYLPA